MCLLSQLIDRYSTEVQHALHRDGALYKAVKATLSVSKNAESSSNLQAVWTVLDGLKEKYETELHNDTEPEEREPVAQAKPEEEVDGDGYQTVDLNAYSDSKLMPFDTGDTGEITDELVVTNGLEIDPKELKVVDNEPDLDVTLMADDHNDTGDHSDIEMDPLAISETSLTAELNAESALSVSPMVDGQVDSDQNKSTSVKEDEYLMQNDTQIQADLSVTESASVAKSESSTQLTRSKSKAIPPRVKSAGQHNEAVRTPDSSSNSVTSATPSSVGGILRISLSEPHSLEKQTELCNEPFLSLGSSLGHTSAATTSSKSTGRPHFAQRVESALNAQLSISSVASTEEEDDLIAIPVSKGGSGGASSCLLYTSPSPRDATLSRMPSSA